MEGNNRRGSRRVGKDQVQGLGEDRVDQAGGARDESTMGAIGGSDGIVEGMDLDNSEGGKDQVQGLGEAEIGLEKEFQEGIAMEDTQGNDEGIRVMEIDGVGDDKETDKDRTEEEGEIKRHPRIREVLQVGLRGRREKKVRTLDVTTVGHGTNQT